MMQDQRISEAIVYMEREKNTANVGILMSSAFIGQGDKAAEAYHQGFVAMDQMADNVLSILRGEVDSEGRKVYDND